MHERFELAVRTNDDVAASREGRVVTDADNAEWGEADAAEVKALSAVQSRPALQISSCRFERSPLGFPN